MWKTCILSMGERHHLGIITGGLTSFGNYHWGLMPFAVLYNPLRTCSEKTLRPMLLMKLLFVQFMMHVPSLPWTSWPFQPLIRPSYRTWQSTYCSGAPCWDHLSPSSIGEAHWLTHSTPHTGHREPSSRRMYPVVVADKLWCMQLLSSLWWTNS